jgi:hypothetical protein
MAACAAMTSMNRTLRWLSGTTPVLLALMGTACEKTGDAPKGAGSAASTAPAPPPATAAASAPAAASAAPDENIPPPTPVVSGDPDVPVNEGIVGTQPVPSDYSADTPPPAPVIEDKPPSPEPADTWVPGYWWWSRTTKHYAWVSGGWRNPPADQIWAPGAWTANAGHYYWRPGFWGAKGYVPAPPAEMAPPPMRVEPQPPSPGAGYAWAPGYYAWKNNAYGWTPGAWSRPPHEGLSWVAPTYVTTGGHYYFQPGRWDHPIAQRGIAYRPDATVRPGAHFKPVALPPAVVAEHEAFVVRSNEAVVRGATRLPTGGYVLHHEPARMEEPGHPGAAPPPPRRP